jgi:uncharacterized protein (DUF697 family)
METKETLLHLSERLEKLVNRLPAALQKPILQELVPLKDLFLRQRAPRIVLAGDPGAGSAGLFNAIFTAPVAPFAEAAAADAVPMAGGWQDFSHQGQGVLRLLDTRSADAAAPLADATRSALAAEPPDLFLFLRGFATDDAREAADLDRLDSLLGLAAQLHTSRPCVVGVVVYSAEAEAPAAEMDAARGRLQAALATRPQIARRLAPALDVATFMRFRLDGSFDPESDRRRHIPELVHVLVTELPNEARLEMARLSGAREAQAKIAQTLIKSVSAVSGALGAQPIPLADLPFLLTFQIAMVAGIIYISGRELSLKLATEFMGTLGFNVGLGLALREGARAAARAATKLLLPGIGNAVSGLVAAGGTYAIGRAASAYFIEGMSLPNVRLLFKTEGRMDRSVFNLLHRRKAKELPKPDAA